MSKRDNFYSLKAAILTAFLLALLAPTILISTFIIQNSAAQSQSQKESVANQAAIAMNQSIHSELRLYRRLAKMHCSIPRGNKPDLAFSMALEVSPLIACGIFLKPNSMIPIHGISTRKGDYLSQDSLQMSDWWKAMASSNKALTIFDARTAVQPPYFRKFVLISDFDQQGRRYFALFDALNIYNLLTQSTEAIAHNNHVIPIILTEAGRVFFSPDTFRYTLPPVINYKANKTWLLNNKEYSVLQRSIPAATGLNAFVLRATDELDPAYARTIILVMFCFGVIVLVGIAGSLAIQDLLAIPITSLAKSLRNSSAQLIDSSTIPNEDFLTPIFQQNKIREVNVLIESTNAFLRAIVKRDESISKMSNEFIKVAADARIGQVTSQVAHDIRSPLAALAMVSHNLSQIPEEKRIIIRSAIARIQDIANNLVVKHQDPLVTSSAALSCQLLTSLIDELVTEKRMQYRSRLGIEIQTITDLQAYGLFANVQPSELKRVLSNLINNSVEAIANTGRIDLLISATDESIKIEINDNGCGIPPEILPQLTQRGHSHGKADGLGLGLFHARRTIESWNGHFEINSKLGTGTSATITLPRARAPNWFVPKLCIKEDSFVVILDDDTSTHQIWRDRFLLQCSNEHRINLIHLSTPKEFETWYANMHEISTKFFLFDFELLGYVESGLDLIEKFNLHKDAVLVTSHYENPQIRERCERRGIKLIPKTMVGFIPIELTPKLIQPDAILIDDDELVHMTWKTVAKGRSKNLESFTCIETFFENIAKYDTKTPIYIDSQLGNGIQGEVVARKIYQAGFVCIYLATGNSPRDFPSMPWIREVVAKTPPAEWYV